MPSFGSWRSHLGFAKETTYGTTVATPDVFIPALTLDDYTDDQGVVLDDANRASPTKVYAAYTGIQQGKWSATFPYYPGQTGRFWTRVLGTEVIASSSNGGWQHAITTNSSANPPSDTVFVFFGSTYSERQFVGSIVEALDFKFSRATGMATMKVGAKSASPSSGVAEQAPSYTSDYSLRGWQCVFAINGTTQNTLQDFELNVTRDQELIFAGNNSQRPSAFESGELDVKGKFKLYGSTEKPYQDYKTGTQQTMDLLLVDSTAGPNPSTVNRLELSFGKIVYTKVTPNITGKYLAYDIEFQAIHNTSAGGDSGPMSVFSTVTSSCNFL